MGFRITILLALITLAAGCGGGADTQVTVDTSQPPLDFTFRPPAEPMSFNVDFSTEAEIRGTALISSVRYSWEARDWQQDGEDWTCEVRFKNIRAAMRRGSGIAMEPIEEFDRLEGFATRYRRTREGFSPVSEPAKDREFKQLFGQLQAGLVPLDFAIPDTTVHPGGTWIEVQRDGSLEFMREAMKDSTITYTYRGDEVFQGGTRARLHFSSKVALDGELDIDQGPMSGNRVRMTGKIESSGDALLDKERGFLRRVKGKSKVIINQQELDERGKEKGSEFSIVQNLNFSVTFSGH